MTNELRPLPEGWEWTKFTEVAELLRGVSYERNVTSEKPQEGYLPILRATNIQENCLITDNDLVYVPKKYVKSDQLLKQHDIIICMSSGSKHLVGKTAQLSYKWKGSFGTFCAAARVSEQINQRFAGYFFESPEYNEFIRKQSSGVNINNLRRGDIEELTFPLPPLAEQHRIVEAIETQFTRLEAGMAALKRARARLKRYRAAVLKAACEGQLVPIEDELAKVEGRNYQNAEQLLSKMEKVEEGTKKRAGRLWGAGVVSELSENQRQNIPPGWHWVKVKDLGPYPDEVVQVGPMSMQSREFKDSGIPVFNVGCVQWGYFDESKLNFLPPDKAKKFERYRIQPQDILFTRSGYVGRCAIATQRHDNWLMTFHLLRVRVSPNVCLPEYCQIVLEGAPYIRKQIDDATIGTTRKGFNTRLLALLDVPLPPLAEQQRIVAEVERRLSVAAEVEAVLVANLTRAGRLRQAILKKAFAGELVPQDAADEPASVLLARIRAAKRST